MKVDALLYHLTGRDPTLESVDGSQFEKRDECDRKNGIPVLCDFTADRYYVLLSLEPDWRDRLAP